MAVGWVGDGVEEGGVGGGGVRKKLRHAWDEIGVRGLEELD